MKEFVLAKRVSNAEIGDEGEHVYCAGSHWRKLFHRSVFQTRGGLRGAEAPRRKCFGRPKFGKTLGVNKIAVKRHVSLSLECYANQGCNLKGCNAI